MPPGHGRQTIGASSGVASAKTLFSCCLPSRIRLHLAVVRQVFVAALIDLFEQLDRFPATRLDVILTGISRTLQVATGSPALAKWDKKVTNVACSAGMVAVKFGQGILCMTGAGDTVVFVIRDLLLKSVGYQTRFFGFSFTLILAFEE